MKVIVLNGPAGVGKDTIARMLTDELLHRMPECSIANLSFKLPMFEIAAAACGVSELEFMERYNNRELKEVPWVKAGGISQRQLMIMISEKWVKPHWGPYHFGTLAANKAKDLGADITIFSDSGFQEEYQVLLNDLGKDNVMLVHIHREGFEFGPNDSRGWVIPSRDSWHFDLKMREGAPEKAAYRLAIEFCDWQIKLSHRGGAR